MRKEEPMGRHMMVAGLAVCCFAVLSGCATTAALSPDGVQVKLANAESVKNCVLVEMLSSRFGGNFVSMERNIDNCQVDLRNKAAEVGATHLVIHPPNTTSGAPWGGSDCNNCVLCTADAYRCD